MWLPQRQKAWIAEDVVRAILRVERGHLAGPERPVVSSLVSTRNEQFISRGQRLFHLEDVPLTQMWWLRKVSDVGLRVRKHLKESSEVGPLPPVNLFVQQTCAER